MTNQKYYTATTKRVWLPKLHRFAHFKDRHAMKIGHPTRRFRLTGSYPAVSLPIDWTKNNTLSFPVYGNDQYGDCMYAAACHGDNTFTGNIGSESSFDLNTIVQDYLQLSGGDNGLNEGQIVGAWKQGLANNTAASIIDALELDPNDAPSMQAAIYFFGGILFMLDVPDAWYNSFTTGAIWDAPATGDASNGHGVWWNGVDNNGNYKLQTWGTYGWITPAGVADCDPTCFVVFSSRWFNPQGIAPNGLSYSQLAALWTQFGGNPLPASPQPASGEVVNITISIPTSLKPGNYTAVLADGPASGEPAGSEPGAHKVTGSSFADPADVATYERCKANGGSEEYCLSIGDNGIGAWGDNTKQGSGASCALSPEQMTATWGSVAAAYLQPVLITNPSNGRTVTALIKDRLPHRSPRIDMNPDTCAALALRPPVLAPVTWQVAS
jgi:hypothetical protein